MMDSTLEKLTPIVADEDEAAIDPTLIMGFMSMILEFISRCRSPEAAASQIRKGGAVAFGQALRIVHIQTELRGKAARRKAEELVKAGTQLTDEELKDLVTDAQDVPQEPPRGIFQFALIGLVFFCGSAMAQDSAKGIFQIDIEQNKRLDSLESKVSALEKAAKPKAQSAPKSTTVCQCHGSNKGLCHCLKAGLPCKCSPSVGSVWNLSDKGVAVSKTGEYANPKSGQPAPKPTAPVVQQFVPVPTVQYVCRNGYCRRVRLFR